MNPLCLCRVKACIRVVESTTKASRGKLYYSCESRQCNFFRWCIPDRATWEPIEGVGQFSPNGVTEQDEVISKATSLTRGAENNLQIPWVLCGALFVIILVLLMKL